jgi:hypothetical protein
MPAFPPDIPMRLPALLPSLLVLAFAGAATAADTPPAPAPTPVIDAADALSGAALAEALRAGGLVLYMRHAEVSVPSDDCGVHQLTPKGDAQAREVGEGMRRLGVPIGPFLVSPLCRTRQTAELLGLGPATPEPDLAPLAPRVDHGAARARLLGLAPEPGRNALLVSHKQGSRVPEYRIMLELAGVIVYRPGPGGTARAVARIAPSDWAALARAIGR